MFPLAAKWSNFPPIMSPRLQPILIALLAFALLFAQQGAALHALSHLAEPPAGQSQQDKHVPHSPACEKCVVYAGIGGAVASGALDIASGIAVAGPVARQAAPRPG